MTYKFDVWLELCFGNGAVRIDRSLPGQLREFRDVQRHGSSGSGGGGGSAGAGAACEGGGAGLESVDGSWSGVGIPPDARLVTFPLEPKPREAAAGVAWVRQHWVL